MRILIVDDNAVNRIVLNRFLQGGPWEVLEAVDGFDALIAFEAAPPDLVLMDLAMPGMDGIEATRRMRAAERAAGRPGISIVAVTASVGSAADDLTRDAGFDEVLIKPVRKDRILELASSCTPDPGKGAVAA